MEINKAEFRVDVPVAHNKIIRIARISVKGVLAYSIYLYF
jgi:hypothetical protein